MTKLFSERVVLAVNKLQDELETRLRTVCQLLGPLDAKSIDKISPEEKSAEILLTMSSTKIGSDLIARLPKLKLVICYGSGTENIDIDALRSKGIALTNGASTNAQSVAEFSMALILNCCRNVHQGDQLVRSGKWLGNDNNRPPLSGGLTGRRVGIYGLGEIGSRVAQMVGAFGCEVGYHSRKQYQSSYQYFTSLEALAGWAEILVLTARGDSRNYHIVDRDLLLLLGAGSYLINVARGMLIDEHSLGDALKDGVIAGAALDVYEFEPKVSQKLLDLNNVLLTPHIAANTFSAQRAQQDRMFINIFNYFETKTIIGRVC